MKKVIVTYGVTIEQPVRQADRRLFVMWLNRAGLPPWIHGVKRRTSRGDEWVFTSDVDRETYMVVRFDGPSH